MSDPFKIEGPAVISFSGGRTSGYMLWRILQAHQWILPDDVKVIFANTGKELSETLDFVRDCSVHWNVPITWVEYGGKVDGKKTFRIVDWNTASRNGEPFEVFINESRALPNPTQRACTKELKLRPMHHLIMSWGWDAWNVAIGIRADEQRRVAKARSRTEWATDTMVLPLADAGITAQHIGDFWKQQVFDLRLPNINGKTMHGNCDLCFLKGQSQILSLIREAPQRALWWANQESDMELKQEFAGDGARFRKDRPSYYSMYRMATKHGELFAFDDEPIQDCMCTD